MKTHAIRLLPDQDIEIEIRKFVKSKDIKAGVILTCVGSLRKAVLRLADEDITKTFDEKFEIVSLVGTLSLEGTHLHISLSGKSGKTIGGHLEEGCIVNTTAEIVVGELDNFVFSREYDEKTGFKELNIS